MYLFRSNMIKLLALSGIVFLMLSITACNQAAEEVDESQLLERETPVVAEVVRAGTINKGNAYTGDLALTSETNILPKMAGTVIRVNVSKGDKVRAGQILFTIDDVDLQNEVRRAEAGLQAAEAQLQQTATQLENGVIRAELGVRNAEAAYQDAQTNLERMRALHEQGAVPRVELEAAETRYNNANLQLESAEKDLQLAKQEEAVKVAETSVMQAVTGLEIAQSQFRNTVVTAPTSGQVAEVNVRMGEMASQQMAAVKIVSTDPILAIIPVPESIISKIKIGDELQVNIPAIEQEVIGKVKHIALAADRQSRMFSIEIELTNTGNLRAGMTARLQLAELSAGQLAEQSLLVAEDAIMRDGQSAYVFVVENNRVRRQTVVLGASSAYYREVLSGLNSGEQVVIRGNTLLVDQGLVRVTEVVERDDN